VDLDGDGLALGLIDARGFALAVGCGLGFADIDGLGDSDEAADGSVGLGDAASSEVVCVDCCCGMDAVLAPTLVPQLAMPSINNVAAATTPPNRVRRLNLD
jgi:hypothetical protein